MRANNLLLAGIFTISLAAGIVTVASMGEPTDITSEPASVPNAEGSGVSVPNGDVACYAQFDVSSTAHCTFSPTARYDYSDGAWREVSPTMRYSNGNRPPTGAWLTAHAGGEDSPDHK